MWVEVALLLLLLVILKQLLKKPDGLPPGRWGLPLFGYIPLTSKNLEEQLDDLHKQHGDVYLWRIGTQKLVFLHDYHMIKEAYNKPENLDRPDWLIFNFTENPALGVASTNGIRWHNNRRFSLRQLRDLGMGKSKLVGAVQEQAQWLVKEMKKQAGKPAPIPHALSVAVSNVIWQMVGSRQFDITDPKLKEFQDINDEFLEGVTRMFILDFFPWVQLILPGPIVNKLCKLDFVHRVKGKLIDYFKRVVDENRATLDRDNPRDLIDSYLVEMEERKEELEAPWHERDLLFILMDLFFAGSNTTMDTLKFTFYYLAANPRVQAKLQAEIDRELAGVLATLEDRSRLPYTEAVIHEVLRMSSLVATGAQHLVTKDIQLGGYNIPKGSILNAVEVSVHHDPRYWKDPTSFIPSGGLMKKGRFVSKKEGFLPFSVGKRNCLGETLARMELFIFTTAVFQNLSFAAPPGKTINPSHDPNKPLFHSPISQDVLITLRE